VKDISWKSTLITSVGDNVCAVPPKNGKYFSVEMVKMDKATAKMAYNVLLFIS
jgi:hypothetical protein